MIKKTQALSNSFKSTFLSAEKDQETIWKKLFIESQPHSENLKKLLVIDQPDCLDLTQQQYNTLIKNYSLKKLKDEEYIGVIPRFDLGDHEIKKSYLLLEFDDFIPTENPEYRDCTISFTVICPYTSWELEDYKLRPHQIAGYIDGMLNNKKLSGIGTLQFMGASQLTLDEEFGGIMLRYIATHGSEDEEYSGIKPPEL